VERNAELFHIRAIHRRCLYSQIKPTNHVSIQHLSQIYHNLHASATLIAIMGCTEENKKF